MAKMKGVRPAKGAPKAKEDAPPPTKKPPYGMMRKK
jgi:hypothetical protein